MDYHPFGLTITSTSFNKTDYRFGFNGMEKDGSFTENDDAFSHYDFGARIYDARLGRWLSTDPQTANYPSHSPYLISDNSPLRYMDPDGESWIDRVQGFVHGVIYAITLGTVDKKYEDAWYPRGTRDNTETGKRDYYAGKREGNFFYNVLSIFRAGSRPRYKPSLSPNGGGKSPSVSIDAPSVPNVVLPPVTVTDQNGRVQANSSKGRSGKQKKLKELANDDKVSSADKGWIKSEMNQIKNGKRKNIRNPPGKDLAHERGREAAKGYGYEHSNLQLRELHRRQHKYDKGGRLNKERPLND